MRARGMEMASKDCVKVAVRVRPFNKRERDAGSRCIISMTSNNISIQDPRNPQNSRTFTFDFTYWSLSGFSRNKDGLFVPEETGGRYADQASVFLDLGQGIHDNALQGYNATLLAYGQTGSGKSYSMVGYGPNKGLIPTLCERLFQSIKSMQDSRQCQVFFSMLEIYNEQVVDLLSKTSRSAGGLRVREDQQRGFYVEGLRRVPCDSAAQVEQLMEQGTRTRTTVATHMNANSSRSHMLIVIQLKQVSILPSISHASLKMSLLALFTHGINLQSLIQNTAYLLAFIHINNLLSALADMALGKKVVHIPYRDSVLTKLLQSALGGNSRTVMIATLSAADICYEESLSTLRYAERAKRIQNKAVVNESPTERLVKELKAENAKLLLRLSRLGQEGRKADDETKELRRLLTHNELQIRAIQTLWEQHLQEALKDWETQYATITQVWMWSKAKFVNRKFLMEEVYQQQVVGGEGADRAPLPRDRDPFWDPLEPLHLGSAHLWLQSLAFRIPLEEQVEVVGPEGTEEAILQAQLMPCSPTGLPLGEDDILIDPSELLGKRLDFQLVVDQCCGLRWVKEARNRGVQIGFQVFDCPQPLYTPAVWHNVNPLLDHRVQFTALRTSQELLNFLQSNALVLELWGLQEGCSELVSCMDGVKMTQEDSIIIDKISASEHLTAETGGSDLGSSLRALHQDLEQLRNSNAALKKENSALREQLNSARNGVENNRGRQERRGSLRPSCDAEFAKALKVFYHSMTSVRGQLQRLRRHKPSEEADLLGLRLFVDEHTYLLKDFSEQLEQCVTTLKQDVAAIVRRKREKSGIWS
ncbi:kinesin-like protein KIF28P [Sinocyclocheilus grahami]|uniref:kinesin-like protein KIF28P n=1 Tax=Sinocyclocheilus grahami TaxID=75366 RepID=UPI0007AC8A78|nr:PREDICTED: kinesin-like protein KIF28P [Sinocyclocheilus grahami]